MGSASVATNDLTAVVESLPPGSVGYLVNGTADSFVPVVVNSTGFLCVGGTIGRHSASGSIGTASANGSFEVELDLDALPGPTGSSAAIPGQTRTFQAWYRDVSPTGSATSNFTDAVTVTFE